MPTNTKQILILFRSLTANENAALTDTNEASIAHVFFEEQQHLPAKLKQAPQTQLNPAELYSALNSTCFQEIMDLGHEKVGTKTVAEHLQIGSHSYWYYFRFMLFYKYRAVRYDIERVKAALEKIDVSEGDAVHVYHSSKAVTDFLTQNHPNVHAHRHSAPVEKSKVAALKFVVAFALRATLGWLQLGKLWSKKKYFLLTNAQANQPVIRKDKLTIGPGDHFTEYLQEELADHPNFLNLSESFPPNLDQLNDFKLTSHLLAARYRNTLNVEFIWALGMFNPANWSRYKKDRKALDKAISVVSDAKLNKEIDLALKQIKSFKRLLTLTVFRKAMLQWFFEKRQFKAGGGPNEHDVRCKSVLELAEESGTQTFGIQHGVIHQYHMHYIFSTADLPLRPIPTVTFMWGKHWEDTLKSYSSYPAQAVKSLGQIRTDIIPALAKLRKADLGKALDNARPVILYPSQPLYAGDQPIRRQLARDVLQMAKANPSIQLLIKPHPKEKDYETFFATIGQEVGYQDFIFVADVDLYKSIAISDLVVVYNSTVGGEAAYFKKPLVVMDYTQNDFSGFIKSGIGAGVHNLDELNLAVQKGLAGQETALKEAQEQFIQARAHQIDGKTAERYIKAIETLAN